MTTAAFTMDLDWADEQQIQDALNFMNGLGVTKVTPFVTHQSETIEERYAWGEEYVGIHPNFLKDDSLADYEGTLNDYLEFWPTADCFRSHAYYDNAHIDMMFKKCGFKFDSNLCLWLQPGIVPLELFSGLKRLPVFWEDDVQLNGWNREIRETDITTPGLKIFNFHPAHIKKMEDVLRMIVGTLHTYEIEIVWLRDMV
jgi:hypothetical protein